MRTTTKPKKRAQPVRPAKPLRCPGCGEPIRLGTIGLYFVNCTRRRSDEREGHEGQASEQVRPRPPPDVWQAGCLDRCPWR